MKVKVVRCHFAAPSVSYGGYGLADTINEIGYENILQILPCYAGQGEYFYPIIYKDN